jgi:hypothetical protein
MLVAGDVQSLASDGNALQKWQWANALESQAELLRLEITEAGAQRIR